MAERYTDADFLTLVANERRQAIGFNQDATLSADRETALNYYKGEMPDVPALENRSKAVSTDVADAVETVLPDLIEIFMGGDDVATFTPHGPEDEEQAKQETDYVNHVVFNQNDGFLQIYTGFKDALLAKTGIFKWWWEEDEYEEEKFTGKNAVEVQLAGQDGQIVDLVQDKDEYDADDAQAPSEPTYSFTLKRLKQRGRVCIQAVPPEDFAISSDATSIKDATYHAHRSRPRAQDLICEGIDPDIVKKLPSYGVQSRDETVQLARDQADEGNYPPDDQNDLRIVEVIEHYIRIDADGDGKPELWRVRTGGSDSVLIDREKVNRPCMAAITPYLNPHRFYGRSVADVLVEIQRIKTALIRMGLDSGYFALNQRFEVGDDAANDFTIADLLNNEPGFPVRSKTGEAVRPLSGPGVSFDVWGALEYVSTMAEQRSGIVRNAQGLNPDTLHDTAKGAMALMNAAQKRIRLIAKIFAETGLKDMFLGVHATIRENATASQIARLRNKWIPVDPTTWAERNDMQIELGLGSSGREQELLALQQVMGVMFQVVGFQQGLNGPFVTPQNAYNLLTRFTEKAGLKAPELYWTDPREAPPQPAQPNPDQIKANADIQIATIKAQQQLQSDKYKTDMDAQVKQFQITQEIAAKMRIAGLESLTDMATTAHTAHLKAQSDIKVGGNPG